MKSVLLGSLFLFTSLAFAQNNNCTAPWGQYVMDGSSVIAYKDYRPTGGDRCQYEYRTCSNGYLSGYYSYGSCTEDYSCNSFEFGYMLNMQTVLAYYNDVEYGGHRCQSEIRQCYYGKMTGSFRHRYCTERP